MPSYCLYTPVWIRAGAPPPPRPASPSLSRCGSPPPCGNEQTGSRRHPRPPPSRPRSPPCSTVRDGFGKERVGGNPVHGEACRSFHPAAEVEEGDERGRLVYPPLLPAGRAQGFDIRVGHRTGRLGQLLRVAQQRAGL